jgi:hypothetical protein
MLIDNFLCESWSMAGTPKLSNRMAEWQAVLIVSSVKSVKSVFLSEFPFRF